MNKSCLTYEGIMSQIRSSSGRKHYPNHMCDVTHPYESNNSFASLVWLILDTPEFTWLFQNTNTPFSCEGFMSYRPTSFLGAGFRPRIPPFVWFVPLAPNLSAFLMCTHLSEPGLISAGFQWTGSTPVGFQAAFRAVYEMHVKDSCFHVKVSCHTYEMHVEDSGLRT